MGSQIWIIKGNISPELTVHKEGSQLAYYLTQNQRHLKIGAQKDNTYISFCGTEQQTSFCKIQAN